MDVHPIQVEADVSDGLPTFTMVGFPSAQVKEAQDRVRTALKNNGIALPPKENYREFCFRPDSKNRRDVGFGSSVSSSCFGGVRYSEIGTAGSGDDGRRNKLNGEIHAISGILPIIIRAREEKCRFVLFHMRISGKRH